MYYFSGRSAPYEGRNTTEKKRIDDYSAPKREDYKRDDYKQRDTFKRPVVEYQKRNDIDPPPRSSTYDSRSVGVHRGDPVPSKDRYGMTSSDSRPSNNFSSSSSGSRSTGGRDDRDPRFVFIFWLIKYFFFVIVNYIIVEEFHQQNGIWMVVHRVIVVMLTVVVVVVVVHRRHGQIRVRQQQNHLVICNRWLPMIHGVKNSQMAIGVQWIKIKIVMIEHIMNENHRQPHHSIWTLHDRIRLLDDHRIVIAIQYHQDLIMQDFNLMNYEYEVIFGSIKSKIYS